MCLTRAQLDARYSADHSEIPTLHSTPVLNTATTSSAADRSPSGPGSPNARCLEDHTEGHATCSLPPPVSLTSEKRALKRGPTHPYEVARSQMPSSFQTVSPTRCLPEAHSKRIVWLLSPSTAWNWISDCFVFCDLHRGTEPPQVLGGGWLLRISYLYVCWCKGATDLAAPADMLYQDATTKRRARAAWSP